MTMFEFFIPIAIVALAVCGVRRIENGTWFSRLAKGGVSMFAVLTIFFVGLGVFLWNPINNRTGSIWVSWEAILSNATIAVGMVAGWWLSLAFVWKKRKPR